MFARLVLLAVALSWSTQARAWWGEGQMQAALAYEQLTPAARAEANRLILMNPDYTEWLTAIPSTPDHQPIDVDR